ncbi:MAG: hypothetical protein A2860_00565 [Candidatus Levybacteria bacterium RIFCSPHIGHO2_01_FULL_37_33]|nr:MAG: hypothetical protein A2860_00565 [Candidatus Levybacteria bacterium RIFCSPHIGHO2_01_FULL_37_33]
MSKDISSERNLTSIELGPQAKGFVSFFSKDPSLNRVIKDFRYGYIRASSFFKKKIPKVKLTLVYSREEMNNLLGYKTASWFVGYAGSSSKIFMLSPSVFDRESNHSKRDFRKVLCHEICHLFIRQIHNSYEPVWLEEGLAYCVAGQESRLKNSNPIFNNPEVIFLIDTRNRWNKTIGSQPDVPYALAFLLVDFLIRRYDKDRVIKLLMSLEGRYNKKTFCQKFKELYGKDIKLILKEFFSRQNEQKGGENYVSRTQSNI